MFYLNVNRKPLGQAMKILKFLYEVVITKHFNERIEQRVVELGAKINNFKIVRTQIERLEKYPIVSETDVIVGIASAHLNFDNPFVQGSKTNDEEIKASIENAKHKGKKPIINFDYIKPNSEIILVGICHRNVIVTSYFVHISNVPNMIPSYEIIKNKGLFNTNLIELNLKYIENLFKLSKITDNDGFYEEMNERLMYLQNKNKTKSVLITLYSPSPIKQLKLEKNLLSRVHPEDTRDIILLPDDNPNLENPKYKSKIVLQASNLKDKNITLQAILMPSSQKVKLPSIYDLET